MIKTKKKVYLDQRFTAPQIDPNDFQYVAFGQPLVVGSSWDENVVDDSVVTDDFESGNVEVDQSESQDVSDGGLQVPTNLTIVSQNVHTGTTGTTLVDLVIQFDDVPSATKYNARFSKS